MAHVAFECFRRARYDFHGSTRVTPNRFDYWSHNSWPCKAYTTQRYRTNKMFDDNFVPTDASHMAAHSAYHPTASTAVALYALPKMSKVSLRQPPSHPPPTHSTATTRTTTAAAAAATGPSLTNTSSITTATATTSITSNHYHTTTSITNATASTPTTTATHSTNH